MSARDKTLPLVYSCSGCSSAAQMANHLAVQLDRRGVAEMSCIAGVGGNVPSLVKVAQSGRAILALDGCPLECVKNSLAQRGVRGQASTAGWPAVVVIISSADGTSAENHTTDQHNRRDKRHARTHVSLLFPFLRERAAPYTPKPIGRERAS